MSSANGSRSCDCAPVTWAYGTPCPAMVSPNVGPRKESKLLYPDHHLIRCTKSGFRPAHFNNHVADYARVLLHDHIHLHLKHVLSHLVPNGILMNWNLPQWLLNVISLLAAYVRGTWRKVFKLSTLVYTVYCLWFVTLSNDCSVQATRTQMEIHCMINISLI